MDSSFELSINEVGNEGILSLTGDLTLLEAEETKRILVQAIGKVETLYLDISEIQSVDMSFIQLLCASHRECFLSNKDLLLQGGCKDNVNQLLHKAGYTKQCGCYTDARKSCLWSTCNTL